MISDTPVDRSSIARLFSRGGAQRCGIYPTWKKDEKTVSADDQGIQPIFQ